jgi:hypothetical protein
MPHTSMPKIAINDQLDLAFSFDTNPLRMLGRYLQNPASINLRNLPSRLDEMPFGTLQAGLDFETPVGLGTGPVELTVGAGVSGALTVFVPKPEANDLFEDEHYGEPVEVAPDQAYTGVSLIASVEVGVTGEGGDITFGIDAGTTVRLTSYKRFSTKPEMPRLVDALRSTLEEFVIPRDVDDLEQMQTGAIATVEGSGTLRFAAEANLLAVPVPIASIAAPIAARLPLEAGAAVSVASSLELSSEYQVRVEKIGDKKVRLGYYKKRGAEFTIALVADAGISSPVKDREVAAPVGEADLIARILGGVSRVPLNPDELKKAGLSDTQIGEIENALRDGLSRKLALAASAELGGQSSREAAFLFDVDLRMLDARGGSALKAALGGNLLGLTTGEVPPAGITLRRSILSKTKATTQVLRLNVFGIYDLMSLTRIVSEGTVVSDPVTGISILDKASATRVRAASGQLDPEKLRRLLADFFLITAAYRGSRLAVGSPELSSTHTYTELHARTNAPTMRDNLEIGEALGLISQAAKEAALEGVSEFGRTIVVAEVEYNSALCRRMFLAEDGKPRQEEDYDRAGRAALALLVPPSDPEAFRRAPLTDDALWARMKDAGQPSFRQLFPRLDPVRLAEITGDYTLIRWWAKTMSDTAAILGELDAVPTSDPEDKRFSKMRSALSHHLRSVAADTKPRWNDPWGLITMDVLTGHEAKASIQITGPKLNISKARGQALETAAAR